MSKFQLTLSIIFGAFIFIAVALFSVYRGSSGTQVNVTVWGTLPSADFATFISGASLNTKTTTYTYVEKREATIEKDYTEALATGHGPDLIILPQALIYKNRAKLTPIPYSSVSQGDYQNIFINEGDLFLGSQGIYALPVMVDPLVMYWNKDALSSVGLAKPLSYWDEIYSAAGLLTQKDAAGNITRSVMALGETKNIPHAKDILSLLMLQAGSRITSADSSLGLQAVMDSNEGLTLNPAGSAVEFYTQFSDPSKPFYSWNRSLLPAQSSFSVGDSAFYIGYASELKTLHAKSPTLNIGVAPVPQSRTSRQALTYGRLYGVAISRASANPSAALGAALGLVTNAAQQKLSEVTGLPPVRRDLLSVRPNDSADQVFYTSAIQSKGWIDPDVSGSDKVFTDLIDSVTSGRARASEAVSSANDALQALIDKQQ